RDETLRGQLERGEVETIRQRFVPNLATGVIDSDPKARGAGSLFVQPRVRRVASGDALLLDDVLKFRFLIATTSTEAHTWLAPESLEMWRRLRGERIVIGSMPGSASTDGILYLTETDALFASWMSQHGSAAVVVRPDRYVFGMGNDAVELNRLVADVGRLVLAF